MKRGNEKFTIKVKITIFAQKKKLKNLCDVNQHIVIVENMRTYVFYFNFENIFP